jgi:multiple sugar transport system permease protein
LINTIPRIFLHIFLAVGGLIMVLPFIWMILSSFKPSIEVISVPFKIWPTRFTLENYYSAFEALPIARGYLNSLIVSTAITALVLFSSSAAGYLFAKLKFRGSEVLFFLVIASIMIPPQIVLIPLYIMTVKLRIINSYVGLVLPFAISAFGVFLMRQFIHGIPNSLVDAARIDGASDLLIYWKLILPLTRSAFSVLGILTFIWSWDEFLWPLVIIDQNSMKTLPVILGHFTMSEGRYPGETMASVSLVIFPVLIVYAFFQRHIVKGMSMTGLKY